MKKSGPIRLMLVCMAVISACTTPKLSRVVTQQYVLSDSLQPVIDSSIYRLADPYRKQLAATMNEVLCSTSTALEKGSPEGALGNFVTDVCLEMGNRRALQGSDGAMKPADFVILNNGGLRKPLPKGAITLGDLYEVMPFENQLVVLTCNGSLVKRIIDFIATKDGTPVSGIRFRIDKSSKTAKDIRIKGELLDTLKTYRIMTADYLANGGDQFELFKSAEQRWEIGLKIRDALISFAREKGRQGALIVAVKEGRITYDPE